MRHLARLLPKGWGLIRISGNGVTVFGLNEKERRIAGVGLVPVDLVASAFEDGRRAEREGLTDGDYS